jgi:hypothetical protein
MRLPMKPGAVIVILTLVPTFSLRFRNGLMRFSLRFALVVL